MKQVLTFNFLFHVRREKKGRAVVANLVESFSYCVVHRRLFVSKCGRILSSSSYHAKMWKSLIIVV